MAKVQRLWRITVNERVARALMELAGETGDSRTLVVEVPTRDFSHKSFDDFMYEDPDKMFFVTLMSLVGDGDVTIDDVRESRIYQVTRVGGREQQTLAPNQDFRDALAFDALGQSDEG